MRHEVTDADREQMAAMRESGLSLAEISRRTGRTKRVICRALQRWGVKLAKRNGEPTEAELEATIAARRPSMPIRKSAADKDEPNQYHGPRLGRAAVPVKVLGHRANRKAAR